MVSERCDNQRSISISSTIKSVCMMLAIKADIVLDVLDVSLKVLTSCVLIAIANDLACRFILHLQLL